MVKEQAIRKGKCIFRKQKNSSVAMPATLTFYEQETCKHALDLFFFLIPIGQFVSYKEFANLIKETYDCEYNQQNAEIVRVLNLAHQHILNLPEREE